MARIFFIVSCLIVSLTASHPLFGSEGEQPPTVADLVNRALKQSKLLAASEKAVESAHWYKDQAAAWQNPIVSLGAGSKTVSGGQGIAYQAEVTQPFYFPGKQKLAGEIAGIQEKIAGLDRDEARLFVRYSVIRLAYQYALAVELSMHLEERILRFKAIQGYLASRPFPSPKKRIEKHLVQMRLALMQKDLAEVRSGKDIAWARLNLYLELPAPVAIKTPWFEKGEVLQWESVAAAVQKNNVDVKRQTFLLEKAEAEVKLARKSIYPDFGLSFLYSQESVGKETEQFIGGGVTFSIPLWNANKGAARSLAASAEAEEMKLAHATSAAQQELAASFIEYDNARKNLERFPLKGIKQVHAILADADDSFDKGLIDFITYSEVESQAYQMHLALFGAQYDFVEKYAALCILQGTENFIIPEAGKEKE